MVVKPTLKPLTKGNISEAFGIPDVRADFLSYFCQKIVDKRTQGRTVDILAALVEAGQEAESTEEAFFIFYYIGGAFSEKILSKTSLLDENQVFEWLVDDMEFAFKEVISGNRGALPKILELMERVSNHPKIQKLKKEKEQESEPEQLKLPFDEPQDCAEPEMEVTKETNVVINVPGSITMTADKTRRIRNILEE